MSQCHSGEDPGLHRAWKLARAMRKAIAPAPKRASFTIGHRFPRKERWGRSDPGIPPLLYAAVIAKVPQIAGEFASKKRDDDKIEKGEEWVFLFQLCSPGNPKM